MLATKMLDPLARFDKTHPLGWKSRIDEIVCYRLLANYATALKRLESAWQDHEQLPAAIRLRLLAEWIQLARASGDLSQATRLASADRTIEEVTSPERDFAALEAYLAAWQEASQPKDEKAAARWQAAANETVRVIQAEHGPYWTRRAQMLLSRYVHGLPGADLQTLVPGRRERLSQRTVRRRAGRLRSRAHAGRGAGQPRRGVPARLHRRHDRAPSRANHEQAASRYREVATAAPDHERAPEAHLLALHHAGQAAAEAADRSFDQYVAIAREHLATWPNGPTADEVRRRLGGAYELQRQWPNAIEQYQAISPGNPKFAEVIAAVARAYKGWLEEAERKGEPTGGIAAQAAAWFESLIVGPQGRLPERWSPVDRTAATEAARFRLNYGGGDPGRAEQDPLGRARRNREYYPRVAVDRKGTSGAFAGRSGPTA